MKEGRRRSREVRTCPTPWRACLSTTPRLMGGASVYWLETGGGSFLTLYWGSGFVSSGSISMDPHLSTFNRFVWSPKGSSSHAVHPSVHPSVHLQQLQFVSFRFPSSAHETLTLLALVTSRYFWLSINELNKFSQHGDLWVFFFELHISEGHKQTSQSLASSLTSPACLLVL